MKTLYLSMVLLLSSSFAHAAEFTNTFAIFLVDEEVPRESIIEGTAAPKGLKLKADPIISDSDWVKYNTNDHSFVLTKAAIGRVAGLCNRELQVPFVMVAGGERVYVGIFTTSFSSTSSSLPSILLSLGLTEATADEEFTIHEGYPPPSGFGNGPDRRGDHRIIQAVEKLFRATGTGHKR